MNFNCFFFVSGRAQQKLEKDKSVEDLFDIPAFENPSEMQQYFMEQITLGDELLQRGNFLLCFYCLCVFDH